MLPLSLSKGFAFKQRRQTENRERLSSGNVTVMIRLCVSAGVLSLALNWNTIHGGFVMDDKVWTMSGTCVVQADAFHFVIKLFFPPFPVCLPDGHIGKCRCSRSQSDQPTLSP